MTGDRVQPGRVIQARPLRRLAEGAEALARLRASGGLRQFSGPAGPQLGLPETERFPARLSGNSSPYTFAEVYGVAGGLWGTLTSGRTGTAYEENGLSGLDGKVVMLEREDVTGEFRFLMRRQGAKSTKVEVQIPGCLCLNTPGVLSMTSSNTAIDDQRYQNATIRYQAVPPEYSTLGMGANAFLSDESFTDPTTGDVFRYYYTCNSGTYTLHRAYAFNFFVGGPFLEATEYSWPIGAAGNTCTPYLMSNGSSFDGAAVTVVVSG